MQVPLFIILITAVICSARNIEWHKPSNKIWNFFNKNQNNHQFCQIYYLCHSITNDHVIIIHGIHYSLYIVPLNYSTWGLNCSYAAYNVKRKQPLKCFVGKYRYFSFYISTNVILYVACGQSYGYLRWSTPRIQDFCEIVV